MKSRELFVDQAIEGALPAQLAGVARDSRSVTAGSAFIAQAEGAERELHLAEALRHGAAATVAEPPTRGATTPHARYAFARASCAAHGLPPPFPVLAVTGTKGKSTVTHFAWAALGRGAARIGTVGWHDGVAERPNPQTTPPPDDLHRFLAGLPAACPGVVFEASSHGLDQHRLAGLRLTALAVTNIGRDHLDYHGTTAAYIHAKLRAVRLLADGGLCVINADDEHAHRFAHAARCAGARIVALGVGRGGHHRLPGCASATAFRRGPGWVLDAPGSEVDLPVALPGGFNAWNAAAAVLLAEAAGVPLARAAERLADAPPVPGRLELLARAPLTYVDYAHTPESLAAAIAALRETHPGRRLGVVFGCGGDRDPGKRAPMGAAAASADVVILTDDNPRSEDPSEIVRQIMVGVLEAWDRAPLARPGQCDAAGAPAARGPRVEHDRGRAILAARAATGADGVVLVAGKGHETTQKFSDRTIAWDDRAFVGALVGSP